MQHSVINYYAFRGMESKHFYPGVIFVMEKSGCGVTAYAVRKDKEAVSKL